MTITFTDERDFPDKTNDLTFTSSGITEEDEAEEDFGYANRYVEAVLGKFPDCMVALIVFLTDHIRFDIIRFGDGGICKTDTSVKLVGFPKKVKMTIAMGDCHESYKWRTVPDTYVVENLAEFGEPMHIVIEEYKDSALLRTCELGEDDKGKFVIIEEES